jgi:hypothetical protein
VVEYSDMSVSMIGRKRAASMTVAAVYTSIIINARPNKRVEWPYIVRNTTRLAMALSFHRW